jgi:predicted Rdx family selenoprotein
VFDIDPELVEGSGGIFEVEVDARVVWTNDDQRGYVPDPDEVLPHVARALDRSMPGQ